MHERIKFLSKLFKPTYPNTHSHIQTRFYYDIEDIDHFVILTHDGSVIRPLDVKRGYVTREWLKAKIEHAIHYLLLTPRSCLVECLVGKSNALIEKKRVYVR